MSAEVQMLMASGEPLVLISDQSISETHLGAASTATYTINASGIAQKTTIDTGTVTIENWITPQLGMGNYEVRATLNSGTLTSGTTGSWLNCGTSRSWTCSQGVVGIASADLTIEIRNATTLAVRDSAHVTLYAEFI